MMMTKLQHRAGCAPGPRAHHRSATAAAAACRPVRRGSVAACAAAQAPASTHQLALHLGETTLQLPCAPHQAKVLDAALSKLLQTFADKQSATRPQRWEAMDVCFKGEEAGAGLEVLEVFCNPNSFKTAFDAKLMISVRAAGGLKVTCEGRLSNVKADVDAYLADL